MKFLTTNPPRFTAEAAADIARKHFGLTGQITALYSERDQNFRIRGAGDWVLKIANEMEAPDLIDAQVAALDHLARTAPDIPLPKVRRTADGAGLRLVAGQGEARHATFAVSYLPGRIASDCALGPDDFHAIGAMIARVERGMRGFFHPALGNRALLWDIRELPHLCAKARHLGPQADEITRLLHDVMARTSGRLDHLVLVSEMDNGMARSAQAHTTADLAAHLGMAYAYGVEFVELGLGSETEREFCTADHNALGWHGNGLMAATTLAQPFLLRLPGQRFWFLQGGDQPRLGERMAIGAVVQTVGGPVVMVSTHLESNATAAARHAQMACLLDALEADFPGLPLLIGGDLNTGNHIGGDWRAETLFDLARARGFAVHGGPEDQMTTRPSLITRWPDRAMKLDWFLARGLDIRRSWIVPSTDRQDKPLSDHDMVLVEIAGLSQL